MPPLYYVGTARWRTHVQATVTVLLQRLTQSDPNAVALLGRSGPLPRQLGPYWRQILRQAHANQCFWCQQRMTASGATLEHVLPYHGSSWPTLSRLEQLLSLQLSHPFCNHGYRDWRQAQAPGRLTRMDDALIAMVRQVITTQPVLRLYAAAHDHPEPGVSSS